MSTEHFVDVPMAIELLERAVAEKGADHVYRRVTLSRSPITSACLYFDPKDETPSCIIGHALSYLGFTYAAIAGRGNGEGAMHLRTHIDIDISDGAADVWGVAQALQDRGDPWGDALKGAKAHAAELGYAS